MLLGACCGCGRSSDTGERPLRSRRTGATEPEHQGRDDATGVQRTARSDGAPLEAPPRGSASSLLSAEPSSASHTLAPTATATAFPTLEAVAPPAHLASRLARIEKNLGTQEATRRALALEEIESLVREEPADADLARHWSTSKDPRLVKASFRLWNRLDRHPLRVGTLLTLLGHPRDDLRHGALGILVFDFGRPEGAAQTAPYLRRLLADPSCPVRRDAYGYLLRAHRVLGLRQHGVAMAALRDPCPAVRLVGLEYALGDAVRLTETEAARVATLARSSRYPLERCAAFRVLARIRHPEAEAILAQGLAVAAGTTLLVGFQEKGAGSLSMGIKESLPECAAQALDRLTGEARGRSALEKVLGWRGALARKMLVGRPPGRLCLSETDCQRDREVCLHLACTPFEEAREAFFQHRKAERCQAGAPRGRVHNEQPVHTLRLGFGLDPLGPFRIQMHLTRVEPETYAARTKTEDAEACSASAGADKPAAAAATAAPGRPPGAVTPPP